MYYQVKAYRVQLKEFWWETKLFIWVAVIIKLFRLSPRGSTDDLAVDSLHPFEVDAARIAPETVTKFEPVLADLRQLGFNGEILWHDELDPFQATHNTLASLVHQSGQAFVRVQRRENKGRVPPKIKLSTTFISPTRDSGFIVTANGKPDMAWPVNHAVERHVKMPVAELWKTHQSRLAQQRIVLPKVDQSSLRDHAEAYHVSLRDFHLQRGVFAEIPEAEQALYKPDALSIQPATTGTNAEGAGASIPPAWDAAPVGPPDLLESATFAELARLQRKTSSWRATIAILGVSLLLFILSFRAAGPGGSSEPRSDWDWQFVMMMVPILFIHECGHYIAMRGFGYRNLRMFFIPFFGAAVSGKHYGVPGWKKVIVSLMGPLPGIALGVVAGVIGLALNKDWLITAGLLSLIINGFNLLPLLPFDGGWVAHAVLFSRHYMLDVGFRVLAALGLFALSLTGEKIFMYIAIAMLVSLPASITLAKIVSELRKEAFESSSPDGQSIPPEAARTIFGKLRAHKKRGLTAKVAAQQTLQIFETLNAKPPSALASAGFIALHGGSIVLAAVGAFGIIGARALKRDREFGNDALFTNLPKHQLAPNTIRVLGATTMPADYNSVVVSFANEKTAGAQADVVSAFGKNLATPRFTLLGHVMLVSFPQTDESTRKAALAKWEKQASDVFLESDKYRATISLACKAPAPAADVAKRMMDYITANRWLPVCPPWSSPQEWPLERRATDLAARELLRKLQDGPSGNFNTKEWQQLGKDQLAAVRKGDLEGAERLRKQSEQIFDQRNQEFHAQMQADYPNSPIVKAWFEIEGEQDYQKKHPRIVNEIGPMLGPWPVDLPRSTLVESGFVVVKDQEIYFNFLQFGHTDAGLPVLLRWLVEQGCSDFKFELTGSPAGSGRDDLDL